MPLAPSALDALRRRCAIVVSGAPEVAPGAEMRRIAEWCAVNDAQADRYGEGPLIEGFERKIAALLGLPAGVFMPSGTMAQQIALRIWTERAGIPHFAMHPTAHLELHEQRGYARLHGLGATLLGPRDRPTLAADLAAHFERPAALLVELPAREIGGQLPAWNELVDLAALARSRNIRMHLDGARLWEAREAYAPRTLAEICSLFDSVYVSFYKGIGALSGAMLLGPADFIDEARVWRRRHGGTLAQLHPYVASATMRFDAQLAKMPAYRERAQSLAVALIEVPVVRILPSPPQVSMFHLHFDVPVATLAAARDRLAAEHSVWIAHRFAPAAVPGWSAIEINVGDNLLALDNTVAVPLFARLVALAHAGSTP